MQVATPTTSKTNEVLLSNGNHSRLSLIFRIIVWQIIALLFVELIFWAGLGEEEISSLIVPLAQSI